MFQWTVWLGVSRSLLLKIEQNLKGTTEGMACIVFVYFVVWGVSCIKGL